MRWAGHVERLGEKINTQQVLIGMLNERDHLEDLLVDERIILK